MSFWGEGLNKIQIIHTQAWGCFGQPTIPLSLGHGFLSTEATCSVPYYTFIGLLKLTPDSSSLACHLIPATDSHCSYMIVFNSATSPHWYFPKRQKSHPSPRYLKALIKLMLSTLFFSSLQDGSLSLQIQGHASTLLCIVFFVVEWTSLGYLNTLSNCLSTKTDRRPTSSLKALK